MCKRFGTGFEKHSYHLSHCLKLAEIQSTCVMGISYIFRDVNVDHTKDWSIAFIMF